ncbi:MAG: hypothetical protein C0404_10080 [Verrucomicrobia bacterium]|nr:hypothetical protein [Verrucomicrobiota bacterium]
MAMLVSGVATANAGTRDSLFNPYEHTMGIGSLGGVTNAFSGRAVFDTGGATPRFSLDNGTNWISGTKAISTYGGTAASDKIEAAVFMFDAVNVGSVTVRVQCTDFDASGVINKRALVLGSRSDFVFGGVIDLGGTNGVNLSSGLGGEGGPGAEGGKRAALFHSNPPTNAAGNGGDATSGIDDGNGYGGGAGAGVAGGGGSYGGSGGRGISGGSPDGAAGPIYGYSGLNELYGGSGGGCGWYSVGNRSSGGGGGGALEFVATRNMTVTGSIKANGGKGGGANFQKCGGGGSGGGVILAAARLIFSGSISVSGGAGGTESVSTGGGGGGGGRVAWYCNSVVTGAVVNVSVAGGTGGGAGNSSPGSNGVFAVNIGGFPFPRNGTVITIR